MSSNLVERLRCIEAHPAILLAGVVCLSLAVNFAILASLGAKFGSDSARYMDGADRITHHLGLIGKESSYLGYILFLAFLLSQLHLSTTGVAIVQICVAVLAGLALHELGNHLAGRVAGHLSVLVFLLNPDIFRWNLFILTDALYIDFVILACWSIWKASEGGVWPRILAFGVVLFTASIRPNGWLMPLIALGYWIVLSARKRAAKLVLLAAVVLSLGYGFDRVQFFKGAIAHENPVGALDSRVIVFGYPRTRPAFNDAPSTSLPWRELSLHAVRNPGRTLAIAVLRVAAEFGHVRPFYSMRHNVAILVSLPVIYIFALYGFYQIRSDPLVLLIGSIILYHTLIIAAFFADWDGRFLLHFFPLIGLLSAAGAALFIDNCVKSHDSDNSAVLT